MATNGNDELITNRDREALKCIVTSSLSAFQQGRFQKPNFPRGGPVFSKGDTETLYLGFRERPVAGLLANPIETIFLTF